MSRAFVRQALAEARQSVRDALLAHAAGTGSWEQVEAAQQAEMQAERTRRLAGGSRPVKGMPGYFEFQCAKCGNDAMATVDDLPAPFASGFRPAGRCGVCRGEADV